MTDPTGRSFLSYRRSRAGEAERLIHAQRELGIPTWQDVTDLRSEPTPDELRRVLRDPATANAVLLTTPDVEDSPVIRKIEVVEAHTRWKANDGFFIQPIAAGGLDYATASAIPSAYVGLDNLERWNWARTGEDPLLEDEATRLAQLVLRRRLAEIDARLDAEAPWELTIHTRTPPPFTPGTALAVDWSHRFNGRACAPGTWTARLMPAALMMADAIYSTNPSRPVCASGLVSLPTAILLGASLLAPRGIKLRWRQLHPSRPPQVWSLDAERSHADILVERVELDVAADQLAVVVSVNHDVEEAISATAALPTFRGVVRVRGVHGGAVDLADAGQAVDLVLRLLDEIKVARAEWRGIAGTHFFIAAPVGLAVLLGQLVNGLGPIQTYEHIQDDGTGRYCPAVLVDCSNR